MGQDKASQATCSNEELLPLKSENLVELARQGNRSAFEELYKRYSPSVVKRLTHLLGP